jgi:hypothetical protein
VVIVVGLASPGPQVVRRYKTERVLVTVASPAAPLRLAVVVLSLRCQQAV